MRVISSAVVYEPCPRFVTAGTGSYQSDQCAFPLFAVAATASHRVLLPYIVIGFVVFLSASVYVDTFERIINSPDIAEHPSNIDVIVYILFGIEHGARNDEQFRNIYVPVIEESEVGITGA